MTLDLLPLDIMAGALALGLGAALHCAGMCGGIVGAYSLSLEPRVRDSRRTSAAYLGLLNLGRLGSYVTAGAVAGAIGDGATALLPPVWAHMVLQAGAAVVLVLAGLNLLGLFSRLSFIERLGVPLWRLLEPLTRRLMPVRHPGHALLFGALWGWLPCAMVYAMLLMAVTAGGAVQGALVMATFWAGSLPSTMAAGAVTRALLRPSRRPALRLGLGGALVVLGFLGVLLAQPLAATAMAPSEAATATMTASGGRCP